MKTYNISLRLVTALYSISFHQSPSASFVKPSRKSSSSSSPSSFSTLEPAFFPPFLGSSASSASVPKNQSSADVGFCPDEEARFFQLFLSTRRRRRRTTLLLVDCGCCDDLVPLIHQVRLRQLRSHGQLPQASHRFLMMWGERV